MKHRVLASVTLAAAIAFARPVAFLAQEAGKAADILALARKAIGNTKLDTLKTFSLQSAVQRNVGTMQLTSDVEILLELPDKYARIENTSGGPGMLVAGGGTTGFNGDRPLQKAPANGGPAGGMMIRMGGSGGSFSNAPNEKLTPEQQQQMTQLMLRTAKAEISRLMLGWFAMTHPAANAQYSYAGEAESADGKAYVIDVKNDEGFAARLFIDQQTRLPLMVTYKGPQPRMINRPAGGPGAPVSAADVQKQIGELQKQPPVMADYTWYFDEWRDADGVKFPFKLRRATGGNTTEEWTISKVKVNPKIDAKKFAVDAGS